MQSSEIAFCWSFIIVLFEVVVPHINRSPLIKNISIVIILARIIEMKSHVVSFVALIILPH